MCCGRGSGSTSPTKRVGGEGESGAGHEGIALKMVAGFLVGNGDGRVRVVQVVRELSCLEGLDVLRQRLKLDLTDEMGGWGGG